MKIEIGETYRHKDSMDGWFARVIEILPPKTGINKNGYIVVKVEWTQQHQSKSGDVIVGVYKYFRKSDLRKIAA